MSGTKGYLETSPVACDGSLGRNARFGGVLCHFWGLARRNNYHFGDTSLREGAHNRTRKNSPKKRKNPLKKARPLLCHFLCIQCFFIRDLLDLLVHEDGCICLQQRLKEKSYVTLLHHLHHHQALHFLHSCRSGRRSPSRLSLFLYIIKSKMKWPLSFLSVETNQNIRFASFHSCSRGPLPTLPKWVWQARTVWHLAQRRRSQVDIVHEQLL